MFERIQKAKEHIEITIDAEDYYSIKDSEKKADEYRFMKGTKATAKGEKGGLGRLFCVSI